MRFMKDPENGTILLKVVKNGKDATLEPLDPNTTDGAKEKHVPVATVDGSMVKVEVGSVEHPMTPEHYIQAIALQSARGFQVVQLTPDDKPRAVFALAEGEVPEAVYAYCNLHGLWKAEL